MHDVSLPALRMLLEPSRTSVLRRLFTLVLLLAPFCARAHPVQATPLHTLGCTAVGYTMQVPSEWILTEPCSRDASARARTQPIVLVVTIERHGWWSDARSRSSIGTDIAGKGTGRSSLTQTAFSSITIAGYHYIIGRAVVQERNGAPFTAIELETFVGGYMYKFAASVGRAPADLPSVDHIWASIRFYPADLVPARLTPVPQIATRTSTPVPSTATQTPTRVAPSPTKTVLPSPTKTVLPSPTKTVLPSPTRTVTPSATRPVAPATSTAVPLSSFSVSAHVIPSRIPVGATAILYAQTVAGAACSASVIFATGAHPSSFDGRAQIASANGQLTWSWRQDELVPGGTASVTCTYDGATSGATVFFVVAR